MPHSPTGASVLHKRILSAELRTQSVLASDADGPAQICSAGCRAAVLPAWGLLMRPEAVGTLVVLGGPGTRRFSRSRTGRPSDPTLANRPSQQLGSPHCCPSRAGPDFKEGLRLPGGPAPSRLSLRSLP